MCQEALKIFEDHDDTTGQASCWSALGMAHQALAGHERAVTCFKRAVEFYRAVGGYFEASALLDLGDAQVRVGAAADARGSYRRALSLLRELDHPRAESALARLSALESPSFRRTCGGKADPLDAR
jgi:tetratricopeptide (TPR) repeat protein